MSTKKYTDRQPPVSLICPQCENVFERTASYVRNKQARNPSGFIFCSIACHRLHRWGEARTQEVPCKRCGKSVSQELNRALTRGKYGPFCSHECYGKWRSENLAGENSPAWKGGYTLDYGGSHWKRQRLAARKRDSFCCQDCGKTEQDFGYEMDVHHIIPYDMFDDPEAASDLGNLVTLCRNCHAKRHNGK